MTRSLAHRRAESSPLRCQTSRSTALNAAFGKFSRYAEKAPTVVGPAQVHLIRYADDFIITGHSEELLSMTVKPLVESLLTERGLVLSPEKTLITHIEEGLDFLG
jgi:hypothetical protein